VADSPCGIWHLARGDVQVRPELLPVANTCNALRIGHAQARGVRTEHISASVKANAAHDVPSERRLAWQVVDGVFTVGAVCALLRCGLLLVAPFEFLLRSVAYRLRDVRCFLR
jgi:hypothetical protein